VRLRLALARFLTLAPETPLAVLRAVFWYAYHLVCSGWVASSECGAFFAMVAVTTVLAVVATARRSERVALLGLLGGFLTPLLLSSDVPDRTLLAPYVFLLALGFATLGVRARFRFVEASVFVATALYLPAFAPAGRIWSISEATLVTTALCALFAIAFAIGAVRDPQALRLRIMLLTLDAFAYAGMLAWIFADRQTALGIAFLIVAAVFLIATRFVPVPTPKTVAYGYFGLAAATPALPALAHRTTLPDAFSLEGAALIVTGEAVCSVPSVRVSGLVAVLVLSNVQLLALAVRTAPETQAVGMWIPVVVRG